MFLAEWPFYHSARMAILPFCQDGRKAILQSTWAKTWNAAERPCQLFAKFAESPPCNLTHDIMNI
eukprot:2612722-Pleurochrysis_carterae.AAC.5